MISQKAVKEPFRAFSARGSRMSAADVVHSRGCATITGLYESELEQLSPASPRRLWWLRRSFRHRTSDRPSS